jgi:hypothetical protein
MRPRVTQFRDERKCGDVNRPHRRRQYHRRGEWRAVATAKLFDLCPALSATTQQHSHAETPQRSRFQPRDQLRARDDAADVHPGSNIPQLRRYIGTLQRGTHVCAALAQRDEGDRLTRAPRQHLVQSFRVTLD